MLNQVEMEEKLKNLIQGNSELNRTKWALAWKDRGKKVIGVACPYVPEEVIYAADMLPWRVTGSWQGSMRFAPIYRPVSTNLYYNGVLENFLGGKLDFLDGLVITNRYDDSRRFYDVLAHIGKPPFLHIMYFPHQDNELSYQALGKSITNLKVQLGEFRGEEISEDSLHHAVEIYNKMRSLLMKVYELRRKEPPPLSGAEVLGITTAAMVMPKDEFNKELEALLPYVEGREGSFKNLRPRLLVSADQIDNPAYLQLIEDAGTIIAMDDMDTGSRYFWDYVNPNMNDIIYALAKRYIIGPRDARMLNWDQQVDRVIEWAKLYKIDGILELVLLYYFPREFRVPFFKDKLRKSGIPSTSIQVEYHLSNVGQMLTRIGAFAEILQNKSRHQD